jgi:flagellar biosynthesis protein FlhG
MRSISVTSGKGGVGKTAISINLSLALSNLGARTVIFDADLQLANIDIQLGISPEFTLADVVNERKRLRDILVTGPAGLRVAAGGSAVAVLMNAGPKRMSRFISQFGDLAKDTDIILFDTAAGLDNRVMTFVKLAQEVILVATPDPTSVMDAYATAKIALRRSPSVRIRLLVNMANSAEEGERVHSTMQGIAQTYLNTSFDYLGAVRYDPHAAAAIRRRQPVVLSQPDCPAAKDILAIAQKLRTERTLRPAQGAA